MTGVMRFAATLAAGALVAQPCAAAGFRESQGMQRQLSAFAGLTVRLPLGQTRKAKPTARLQFAVSHTLRDQRTGATQTVRPHGLEIGGTKGGTPALYLNGESTADIQRKLDLGGGTGSTLLIVGGVVLVVVVVAAAMAGSSGPGCPAYEGNTDHCID